MAQPWIRPCVDLAWKSIKNELGHEYFIPTKFGKYPSRYSAVKADYVFPDIYMR